MVLIALKPLEGFSQDFRNPGQDHIATDVATKVFGSLKVNRITETLHRSQISSEALIDDLLKYDITYVERIRDDPIYEMTLQSVREEFVPAEKLIPLTLGGAENHPDFPKDRSPGIPWKTKGYKTKGDVIADPEARKIYHAKWDRIGRGKSETLPDVALFLRAQIAKRPDNKIRAVWGFPLDVVIEEARFFLPYMDWLRNTDRCLPIAYQCEMATGGMKYIDALVRSNPGSTYTITDWSKFDKTIPPWLLKDVFGIFFDCFDLTKVFDSEGLIWPVKEELSIRRARRLINYFINTPVRAFNGQRWKKTGGVPSGSMFTNLIDSLVNIVVSRYVCYTTTGAFPSGEMYLGDDGIMAIDGIVDLDNMAEVALNKFSMNLNAKKSYITTNPANVHFLGYFNRDGKPFKPQDFLIASFIFPERNHEDPRIRISRAIGQMWSTLDGCQASSWLDIVHELLADVNYTLEDVLENIRAHPGHYKYLRILGIDVLKMSVPERHIRFVHRIEAPGFSLRTYKKKVWKLQELYKSFKEEFDYDWIYK